MIYKNLQIPIVFEIGKGVLEDIDEILCKEHLYYNSKILVTSKDLYTQYRKRLDKIKFEEIILVKGGCFEELNDIVIERTLSESLLIAFGGGSVIDLTKVMAQRFSLPYLSIPSALSNDSIYSPVSRLNKRGRKRSFGVFPPVGIIVDISIISDAPSVLQLSGVGDLVSNLSAIKDWELSNRITGEPIDHFAKTLATYSANSIIRYKKSDLKSEVFISDLANGLIVSGLAMIIAKTTRPASGSEHLISHAIDELYENRSTYHGLQVAYAQLFVEKRLRKNDVDYSELECFYDGIGLMEEIGNRISFSNEEMAEIIKKAKTIRNRFTILNSDLI